MVVKRVEYELTGRAGSAVRAFDETAAAANRSGKKIEDSFTKSTSKVGGLFHGLASQASAFGVPFASSLDKIGVKFDAAEGKAGGFGKRLAAIGGIGAAGGIAGLVAIGGEALHLADNFEVAHARLQVAAKNTGTSFDSIAPQVSSVDDKMAHFGFHMNDVEDSLATLTTASHSAKTALGLQGLAANIARGRHTDLATATGILVKVETGHVGALGKLGIATKDASGHMLSHKQILSELVTMYGGQAAAYTDTFKGKTDQLSAGLENAGTKLGTKLMPILVKFSSWVLNTAIPAVGKFIGWVKSEWPKLEKAITPTLDKIKGYVLGFIHTVQNVWSKFGGTIIAFATNAWGSVKTIFSGAFAVIGGLFRFFADLLTGKWGKLWGDIEMALSGAWKVLKGTIGLVWSGIVGVFGIIKTQVGTIWHDLWNGLASVFSTTWGGIETAVRAGINVVLGIINGLIRGVNSVTGLLNHLPGVHIGKIGEIGYLKAPGPELSHAPFPTSYSAGYGHQRRARGGPVSEAMTYLVGERGPELFMPKTAGTIIPHDRLVAALQSARGIQHSERLLGIPVQTIDQIAQQLTKKPAHHVAPSAGGGSVGAIGDAFTGGGSSTSDVVLKSIGTQAQHDLASVIHANPTTHGGNTYNITVNVPAGANKNDEQRLAKAIVKEIETLQINNGRPITAKPR